MIIVAETDPRDAQATALLRQSHALMESLFPQEDNFFLDIDDLCADHIRFYTARKDSVIMGTGAIALYPAFAEVKSMFIADKARGQGVASAILRQLEDTARDSGAHLMKLETGNTLHAAHRLYARHGFKPCDPFPPYEAAASSIFMEKSLS